MSADPHSSVTENNARAGSGSVNLYRAAIHLPKLCTATRRVAISRRWIVLSDHEWKTLREVERQCTADDPDFTRAFEAGQTRLSRHPHQLRVSLLVVAAGLLTTFLVVAGSLGSALVVAAATGLIIWAVRHHSSGMNRQSPE